MPLIFYLILSIFFLSSCGGGGGGGGGGGSTSIAPNTQNNPSNDSANWSGSVTDGEANVYRTAEYNYQNGLKAIKAAQAYALLAKNAKAVAGNGVIVAVTDSEIQLNHFDLAAATSNPALNHRNNFNLQGQYQSHGSHVAGIVAATKNNIGMHGVAFQSSILSVHILGDNALSAPSNSPAGMKYAVDRGAKVVNASWIYVYPDTNFGVQVDVGSSDYYNYKNHLNSDFSAVKNADALTVIATGNNSYNNYVAPPALFAQDADYAGYVLAVGSVGVDSSGAVTGISSFSNHCSQVKNYCLVAPGNNILSTIPNNSYAYSNGTSMATPHVSGAAAVLRAAWPYLKAPQVAQILLQTATDLGAAGVDNVYGHGMLNLYAAVQAQGVNNLPSGASLGFSSGYDMQNSAMKTSAIFGDSFQNNVIPKINNTVFFDDFGRDYQANLGEKIAQNSSQYLPNLQNIILNNITYSEVPARFGKAELKFNLADYKNSEAKNNIGLKYALIDNSQDFQQLALQNNGMSFTQKDLFFAGSKFGFALNRDEISHSLYPEFSGAGFVLENNFAQNPYQNFLQQNFSANPFLNRKFNQFFTQQNFYKGKLGFNFSYQSSRDGENIAANLGKKQNEIFDASLVLKAREGSSALLNVGNLSEFDDNILNAKSSGAFSAGNGVKTTYIKLAGAQNLAKNLQLIASFSQGFSQISGNNNGIFRQFENVRSRALSVALIKDDFFDGKLGLAYIEPMRVYSGRVRYDAPIARDYEGNVIRAQGSVSLAPNGHERNFELFYSRILEGEASLSFNFIMQREGGNIKAAKDNQIGFMTYRKKF